jgi:hypothetical protein
MAAYRQAFQQAVLPQLADLSRSHRGREPMSPIDPELSLASGRFPVGRLRPLRNASALGGANQCPVKVPRNENAARRRRLHHIASARCQPERLRRDHATPTRPRPIRANVAGSGTPVTMGFETAVAPSKIGLIQEQSFVITKSTSV